MVTEVASKFAKQNWKAKEKVSFLVIPRLWSVKEPKLLFLTMPLLLCRL